MSLKKRMILEFFLVSVLGTLFHFLYAWSGQNEIVGIFASVNESVWEHLKLIFWPAFFLSAIEYFCFKDYRKKLFEVKLCSIFSGISFIVVFFYTYSGVLGFNLALVDILSFYIGVFIMTYSDYKLLNDNKYTSNENLRSFFVLAFWGFCFAIWTFNPPSLGIFWG